MALADIDKRSRPSGPTSAGSSADASFAPPAPVLSLPKGGGAIRGIGEKFGANPVTGTGSMSVPIATSPGRSGFGPQLSLSYDSGAGNGPFGFGWSLSLPAISRKTDKGLPQYFDATGSDVFILSGAEDLEPVYRQDADGAWVAGHPGYQRDPATFWVRDPAGLMVIHEDELDDYRVRRYRPRVEGLFARIERWTKIDAPNDVHWRSISKDNILTLYGLDTGSRIADPLDASRIFTWLICETRDDKGNGLLYSYKREDGQGVDPSKAHEHNRGPQNDARRTANRYLKRIHYGNRTPLLDSVMGERPRFLSPAQLDHAGWMFEAVFDYGDHDPNAPMPNDDQATDERAVFKYPWSPRPDPFSSYRSGFEVRTTRLCQRVLMFHHFANEAGVGRDCLVRSTGFGYFKEPGPINPGRIDPARDARPVYTFLKAVTQTGYRRNNGGYDKRSLPPVEFEYTEPIVQDAVEEVDPASLENLPAGLDGSAYRWTDLHGEGIPGILTEQAGAWFYKRNLSPITDTAKFAPLETVVLKPNAALSGGAEFMDLAGDGQPDVVVMEGPTPGLYEHDDAEGWQPFRPFTSRLNRDLREPNLKFVDLDGDGHADVLITEDDAFVWHASLAEEGFGPARRVVQALDEEKGPRIVFADGTQSIYLADLSGDGLTDIVRIRNGEVCYWPNLGYSRFGAKVTMDNPPWFDHPDEFDHKRIRLADIDGSGTTDIIYLHREGVRLYFNQSGNSWSQPQVLKVFPRIDDLVGIVPTDLLGNGTASLVWSSPLLGDAGRPMRYVNLMGSEKPHLLVKTINNLGAETRVQFAPSTKFYLQDKRDGKPWITRLPFPVHVVERVETYDHISRNRFVTRHAYHHGYFDGEEREFRGFGMVEQWDTEEFAALAGGNLPADNAAAASHVPPVHTKTWFHTGAYLGRNRVSRQFEDEYFREPGLSIETARPLLLDDTILPLGLTIGEEREASRALKGSMLRQEVYADDVAPGASAAQIQRARTPYTVTEQNFSIRALQPRGANRHAVFFAHAREAINFHYERNPTDPRVQHALTLEVDDYGNVLEQAAIGYGRRQPDASLPTDDDRDKQALVHITCTENAFTEAIAALADHYRTPLPAESRTYELRKPRQKRSEGGLTELHRFDHLSSEVQQAADGDHDIAYEDFAFARAQQAAANDPADADKYFRRLIEQVRTLYRPDDCGAARNDPLALLALRKLERLALPGESYKLAFTRGLLTQVFQRPRPGQPAEPLLPNPSDVLGGTAGDEGGYIDLDGNGSWWLASGRSFSSSGPADSAATELAQARQHFFLPRRYRDAFGNQTTVAFDGPADPTEPRYDLLMVETRDALANRVTVDANDYRVLQPRLVSDPNGNQTEVAFDTLGMVVGTAVMGKPMDNPRLGDRLEGLFQLDPPQAQIDAFIGKPREASADPNASAATQAAHDLLGKATTRIVYDLTRYMRLGEPPFAATIGRETHVSDLPPGQQSKLQISFSYSDGFGREIQKKIQAEPGPLVEDGPTTSPRWVGNGWTIFNNKGKPVRQYEPFFSATHRFEFGVVIGVSPVLFYDPVERVIATLHPNHTYDKGVFDPWQQTTYDVNDTCAPRTTALGDPPLRETGDPRTDPDVGGYMAAYFKTQPVTWLTWHAQRIGGALGPDEQAAATRAAAHADTPTTAHFDALGRPFLTVARNRVVCKDHPLDRKPDEADEALLTRVELDIEGNQREVRDERKLPVNGLPVGAVEQRIVMRYDYDMLGIRIHQLSMEAGARWALNDVAGKPIRAWDSRGHNFTTAYDALRRPVEQIVRGTTTDSDPRARTPNRDIVVDKIEYGESVANAEALNLRTRIRRHFDSAGEVVNGGTNPITATLEAYDFKGNLLRSARRLGKLYTEIPDWSQDPQLQLDTESFEGSTRYDALSRPVQSVAPHSNATRAQRPNKFNVIQPVFNEANLLERVDVWLERADEPSGLLDPTSRSPSPVGVANIDYDAKGQRTLIDYKTQDTQVIRTAYTYDKETFRLAHLYTRRGVDPQTALGVAFGEDCDKPAPPPDTIPAPATPPSGKGCGLQNLHYTYDPAGNITHIRDDAQQTVYFRNQRVEPSNEYTYDALYRLIQATGREHLGQGGAPIPHSYNDTGLVGVRSSNPAGRFAPNDVSAMGTYTERYVYDALGNFVQMRHERSDAAASGWTRRYTYAEASQVEPLKQSNRLSSTTVSNTPAEVYGHDAHGNMLRMPQLQDMQWDFKDQLLLTRRQRVNNGDADGVQHEGERTYYVYDASGQRVRKVTELSTGGVKDERIYLGGFEIFRRHSGATSPVDAGTATLERETLHVMDDKQPIALVETRTLPTMPDPNDPPHLIRCQFGNHLGSATLELDERAQIISYEEYAPYGSSTYQAVRSQTETSKRYRYTRKERDEESGLYYHGARYYSAWLGVWISVDPAGVRSGLQLYGYCRSNPVAFIDRDGRAPSEWADWLQAHSPRPPGFRGEDVVQNWAQAGEKIGKYITDHPGTPDNSDPAGMAAGTAALVSTVVTVAGTVKATLDDPEFVIRGILRFGTGFSQGADDIAAGNTTLGVSRIVGEAAQGLGIALGGVASARAFGVPGTYRPAPAPVEPAAPPPAPATPNKLAPAPAQAAPASAPAAPNPPPSTPAPAPAAAPAPPAASAPPVHGNSLDSSTLHHVYEIHDTGTPGIPHKTGVSGQPLQKTGLSPRAATQVSKLNKANPVPAGQPPRFSQKVVGQGLPNRRAALAFEQYGVNVQTNTLGTPGVGNKLPRPNQMLGPGAR